MKESFRHELLESFVYGKAGQEAQAEFIEFTPPRAANMTECAILRQAFFRALPQGEPVKDGDKDAKDDLTAEELMSILSMSSDVDLDKILVTVKILLTSKGISQVDGETHLTKPLFELLDMDDLIEITGKYLLNFILASSLRQLRKK